MKPGMNENEEAAAKSSLGSLTFSNLRMLYVVALSTIALVIMINQLLVQGYLNKQVHDSRVINVAGRQRMLSQKLSKIVLSLSEKDSLSQRIEKKEQLEKTLALWVKSHHGLQYGDPSLNLPGQNSLEISQKFADVESVYNPIVFNVESIISLLNQNLQIEPSVFKANIDEIMRNEPSFLTKMDGIVYQFDDEAKIKVATLKKIEFWLMLISLGILVFEVIFIFRPTALNVKNAVSDLIQSENNAKKLASEIGSLYASLESAHKEISDIYLALNEATIFAKADPEGNIFYVSDHFKQLSIVEDVKVQQGTKNIVNISDLIVSRNQKTMFPEILKNQLNNGEVWHDEVMVKTLSKTFVWLDMTVVPVVNENIQVSQLLVICSDISEKKAAEDSLKKLNNLKMEKKIKEQKQGSMLILEGQEEERARIARDIHDGIGQMLTALKFNTESIDLRNMEKSQEKILGIKGSLGELIKEVRKVSFNLAPSVLSDYGIVAVIKNFASEVSKLTGKTVEFKNYTGFDHRLAPFVESNLYRIVQEGVNNALKYAEAENILIALYHDQIKLNIQIIDDGKGFSPDIVLSRDLSLNLGHGISNMKERVSLFNGNFTLSSTPGKGTKISIEASLNSI